jgi:cytochrome c
MRSFFLTLIATFTLHVFAQEGPGLGVEASVAEITAWDISIGPDGAGLPDGSGTAEEGAAIYATQCLICHGEEGEGQLNDRLVGGHGTLDQSVPVKTIGSYWPYATTVFDYTRRAMPYLQPQSLTSDEVYALTAYILFLNGIIEEDERINAQTLPEVEMPNQANFILAYP